ncbi:GyrI-like domain-containing protein [Novosphingobium sp. 9]|uniref:AraC family transcriptional regulator n=1 Tax=Novosphingobium sp. 9 TaxID=2025349 RepID=UPI0021B5E769|nr:AraC family transcriptional regulator [Novosphingobium sp. 9]
MTQNPPRRDPYADRFAAVIARIEAEEGRPADLEALAEVAGFSRYHFHRQFRGLAGLTAHDFAQGLRLHRAAHRLGFHSQTGVTDLAFDAGYETLEAFTRAFRRQFASSPSAFRRAPNWSAWRDLGDRLQQARSRVMTNATMLNGVEIREFAPVIVAAMEHRGGPASLEDTIRRFIDLRREAGLVPPLSRTFTLFPVDPRSVPVEDYRLVLCASVPAAKLGAFKGDAAAGVERVEIPGGRVAVLPVPGRGMDLEAPAIALYRDWLPASGETLRDYPLFCERVRLYPMVPEAEALTELMLPLEG